MTRTVSLGAFSLSRRTSLQIAIAAMFANGIPRSVAGQESSGSSWNWAGNAGHTGELPGPGLNLDIALGELWRIPKGEFTSEDFDFGGPNTWFSGYGVAGTLDGVVFTRNGDSIWARRIRDGELLWTQNPTDLLSKIKIEDGYEIDNDVTFRETVSIVGTMVLTELGGYLICLNSETGEFHWSLYVGSYGVSTVVDNVAYGGIAGNVIYAVELGEKPNFRWKVETFGAVIGVRDDLVYVSIVDIRTGSNPSEIKALKTEDGSEYWRYSLEDQEDIDSIFGVTESGIILMVNDYSAGSYRLVCVDHSGNMAWSISADAYNSNYGWVLGDEITQMVADWSNMELDVLRFSTTNIETGEASWSIDVNSDRWSDVVREGILLCAGRAYALVRDSSSQANVLIVVDPGENKVFGSWDSRNVPFFLADGVLIALDDETEEIVAIGPVAGALQVGGRAVVSQSVTLRGAPGETAMDRGQIESGTVVEVTGDNSQSSDGEEWTPVSVVELSLAGWLPTDLLAGQDGSIRFSPIELSELGVFTTNS